MKKALFISNSASDNPTFGATSLFNDETRNRLLDIFDFVNEIITCDNFKDYDLSNVEYLFTMWQIKPFTESEISEHFPALKAMFYVGGSAKSIAPAFLENNVKVYAAWYANAIPVAEYTVAQIILANKGFFRATRIARSESYNYCKKFPGNYGAKVGLIGCGAIAQEVINLLKAYNIEILVYDPYLKPEKAAILTISSASLEKIFTECITISNHLPNIEETVNMLNYDLFSLMQDNATFINTGRGAQVNEDDLIKALEEKPDRTALLDVTYPEPPIAQHKFYSMENVFLTPHIAGSMNDEIARMGEYMADEAENFLIQKPTKYEVTKDMLKILA